MFGDFKLQITSLFMVRNIKCGYSFSYLGREEHVETKFERIWRNFHFATKPHLVQFLHLTLSLPNATVIEFTVHCQTRLQSKFKGTVETCLFLTVIWDVNLCSLFQKVQGT